MLLWSISFVLIAIYLINIVASISKAIKTQTKYESSVHWLSALVNIVVLIAIIYLVNMAAN